MGKAYHECWFIKMWGLVDAYAVVNESMQYLFDTESHEDTYPSEQLVIRADKFSCVIFNDLLYQALLSLPENQRMVLMLDFWYHWTDEKIATHLGATPRTVYNLRQRAFNTT
jgi:DNA-directed RNA polymerase specialized sigma24 family protein